MRVPQVQPGKQLVEQQLLVRAEPVARRRSVNLTLNCKARSFSIGVKEYLRWR
jgi:hypothetical protein